MKSPRPLLLVMLWLVLSPGALRAEPDEAPLGKAEGYPRGTDATMFLDRFKVGSFTATDKIWPTRQVPRAGAVVPLEKGAQTPITYRFKGQQYTLADYLDRRRITGLLLLKNGQIVAEHYRYGRRETDHFVSFSMAKSITSLLVGIALDKGIIASVDDPAEKYVRELRGAPYGRATIRQLMHMSSGVKFVEDYTGHDDVARLARAERGVSRETPLAALASFTERASPPGEKMHYASSETAVVGYVLARAAKTSIADLTSRWIWQRLGVEADAFWNLGVDRHERCEGFFNATLRDFGRLGQMLADDGRLRQQQIVPRSYLLEATDLSRQPPPCLPGKATPFCGYGYFFWLYPFRCRTFALFGVYGQAIFVQPESKIVMVQTAVYHDARDDDSGSERYAFWCGVLASLGGQTSP